ncbi:MAG: hypothetical protein R2874_02825 [Desulfobacterales bacterium]
MSGASHLQHFVKAYNPVVYEIEIFDAIGCNLGVCNGFSLAYFGKGV